MEIGPRPERYTAPAPAGDARILIVGAGLAGLFLALRLAPRPCTVISPAPLGQAASSAWAQGGLAAALHPQDSPEQHALRPIFGNQLGNGRFNQASASSDRVSGVL
ncbi:MAG: FAD-binding protein, partial [Pseudomonadota bacterium]